jgi:hypothetical protein
MPAWAADELAKIGQATELQNLAPTIQVATAYPSRSAPAGSDDPRRQRSL